MGITWTLRCRNASEQHREDVAEEREEWKQFQETFDLEKLVFIDETWTKTNMTPLRGRAEIGKRVIDYVPHPRQEEECETEDYGDACTRDLQSPLNKASEATAYSSGLTPYQR